MIKATIIIPVFNAEKYLSETLNSALKQSIKNIEIICIDDGSIDNSTKILDVYHKKDKRIKIIRQSNKGGGAARNAGISIATGEYLFFCDADDLMEETLLEKSIQIADKECADIVAFNTLKFNEKGEVELRNDVHDRYLPKGVVAFNYNDCPSEIMKIINPTPWNKIYRKDFILEQNLKFDEISSTNDIAFASVSYCKAKKIVLMKDYLYKYRWGNDNVISSTKKFKLLNIVKALKSAEYQVKNLDYFDKIKLALCRFLLENYVYGFRTYLTDFSIAESREFYNELYNKVCSEDFIDLNAEDVDNEKNWAWLKTFQKIPPSVMDTLVKKRIIVSMTTFPERINTVHIALNSLINQTLKADKICLYLSVEDFPNKEADLPNELSSLQKRGLVEILFKQDNLKSHKKYVYAFQDYADDVIITVDDDLIYEPDLIEWLYISYLNHPEAISTKRAHYIVTENGDIAKYSLWLKTPQNCINLPSMQLIATGGAGCLYPPHLFDQYLIHFLDKENIKNISYHQDDIWLKALQLLCKIPVVQYRKFPNIRYIDGTQEVGLWNTVNKVQQPDGRTPNDLALAKIRAWTDSKFGNNLLINGLFLQQFKEGALTESRKNEYWLQQIANVLNQGKNKKALESSIFDLAKTSAAYVMGRLDLKNIGSSSNNIKILKASCPYITPPWIINSEGRGVMLQSIDGQIDILFKIQEKGLLRAVFRAVDKRDINGNRIPVWIRCDHFIINGKSHIKSSKWVSYDECIVLRQEVENNELIKISIKWVSASEIIDWRQITNKDYQQVDNLSSGGLFSHKDSTNQDLIKSKIEELNQKEQLLEIRVNMLSKKERLLVQIQKELELKRLQKIGDLS